MAGPMEPLIAMRFRSSAPTRGSRGETRVSDPGSCVKGPTLMQMAITGSADTALTVVANAGTDAQRTGTTLDWLP